ncbi:iron-sulfur cluster repair di-iron protein [Armatimonas sp.]|uniref:iron-sulfur cluster repair di-iron protein n=1 Tax=Armatimonas sp. TaxID=1872638 RepID=UPI0037539A81
MTEWTKTLGELVVENPARSRVLEKFELDYCCGGKATLRDACTRKELCIESVLREIHACDQSKNQSELDPTNMPLTELANHIEQTHHAYLHTELPRLSILLDKVVAAHGKHVPYLAELQTLFTDFRVDLEQHMAKEEMMLFPWIRRNEAAPSIEAHTTGLAEPIAVMETEHEAAGDALVQFRALTGGYITPPQACGTFRALLDGLATLEWDMHQHVHLENHLLFPRALARQGVKP